MLYFSGEIVVRSLYPEALLSSLKGFPEGQILFWPVHHLSLQQRVNHHIFLMMQPLPPLFVIPLPPLFVISFSPSIPLSLSPSLPLSLSFAPPSPVFHV